MDSKLAPLFLVTAAVLLSGCRRAPPAEPRAVLGSPRVLDGAGLPPPVILAPLGTVWTPAPPVVVAAVDSSSPLRIVISVAGRPAKSLVTTRRILPWPLPKALAINDVGVIEVESITGRVRREFARDATTEALPPGEWLLRRPLAFRSVTAGSGGVSTLLRGAPLGN